MSLKATLVSLIHIVAAENKNAGVTRTYNEHCIGIGVVNEQRTNRTEEL
jgi:hypothetical protein